MPKEPDNASHAAGESKTRWQILTRWRDPRGRQWSDPTRWYDDQAAAWAAFHAACSESDAGRVDYTVELIRSVVAGDGAGGWRIDVTPKIIERWPTSHSVVRVDVPGLLADLKPHGKGAA